MTIAETAMLIIFTIFCNLYIVDYISVSDNLALGKKGISASGYQSVWNLRYTHDGSRSCQGNVAAINGMAANAEWWFADLVKEYHVRRVVITQPSDGRSMYYKIYNISESNASLFDSVILKA
jgi:hypothetical protein